MARRIAAGIDIGTFQVKAIIAEEALENGKTMPRIIGAGVAPTQGVGRGYIVDPQEVARSIRNALNKAEKMAGEKIKRAYFSTGGVGLSSISATGSVIITRADLEITERDLELALETAESNIPQNALQNRRIINSIPLEYKIDGKPVWGRVEGLKAQKLEIKALFLTSMEHHLQDTIRTAELAGVEAIDLVAGPVAASFVTLNKRQKKAGCLLIDFGAETLSAIVYENATIASLEVFPIGSADITNDIALGLKVSLDDAEIIKLGGLTRTTFPRKKFDDIISARLSDCFELVEEHLKKIERDALLPAGVILTGGGASLNSIKDFAQEYLKLPSQIAEIHFSPDNKGRVKDHIWATACGLAIIGFSTNNDQVLAGGGSPESFARAFKKLARRSGSLISRFLP